MAVLDSGVAMEGASIGPYRILAKIGEGGMGTVWIGEHTLLGRRAAIKVLLPEYTSREEIIRRFFNEARAVTAISDPGIVQVFDFGHAHGSAYIVMELLEGEAMDARLRRIGRFNAVDAMRLMAQVAISLGAAHAKGVIHRDLKPENIFIVGDPAVTGGERTKILDFGIAKLAGDESSRVKTRTGMVMGTPAYMSPEQCRGASTIDARSDIYALGCVLFTMVCGRPPFESEASGDLIIMHVRDAGPVPSQLVPGVPAELDALIARCLEKDPNQRFQSTAELVKGLAAVEAVLFGGASSAPGRLTPAAAIAYRQNPTPAPHGEHKRIATPSGTSPTTLSTASGAVTSGTAAGEARRRRSRLIAGAFIGVLAIGGGAFALVAKGKSQKANTAAAGTASSGGSQESPLVEPHPDAASALVATPPATTIDTGAVTADAGSLTIEQVDAAVVGTSHGAATVDEKKRDKRKPPKTGSNTQGAENAGTTQTTFDRGD